MKTLILCLQCIIIFALQAQDKLYYFKSESTGLVGVRDHMGKIIVDPIFEDRAIMYSYTKAIPE